MNKEQLRKYYHRFCHWQQSVPHYAAVIIKSVYDHEDISGILILLALVVVLETTILYVTHRINKRTYHKGIDYFSQ